MKNQVAIGIDIGGTSIKYGIINKQGKVLWEHKRPTKANTSRQEVEQNIIAAALETKRKPQKWERRCKPSESVPQVWLISKALS